VRPDLKVEVARAEREGAGAGLWYGFMVGPIAWAVDLLSSYALVPMACDAGRLTLLHLVFLATFVAALAGLFLAWQAWGRLRSEEGGSTSEGTPTGSRRRFMALSGMALSTAFALVIAATEIPNLVLATRGCN
jgi:hypothetical protein